MFHTLLQNKCDFYTDRTILAKMYILVDLRLSLLFVFIYRQIPNVSRPKSPHLNRSSSLLQLSLYNLLESVVESIMKM